MSDSKNAARTTISIPDLALVVLIGASGSGKSTFARRHFKPTEVLSSDYFRGVVSDDENDQSATTDAFDALHHVASLRLKRGRLTVIDATNVQPESRAPLVALARKKHVLPVAIVLDVPEVVCRERNESRPDRAFGPHVVRQQRSQLRRGLRGLRREGFRQIWILESAAEIDSVVVERAPLWNDKRGEHGPFDIVGDIHGCREELEELLGRLGYAKTTAQGVEPGWTDVCYAHPQGRRAIFLGDLVDRGTDSLGVVGIVRNMVATGAALCVPGNHDMKLLKKLQGKDVRVNHGLEKTLAEIDALADDVREPFCRSLAVFLDGLVSHYVLDGGRLVVAHAGMKESMQGRGSGAVRDFALYGETTGETDEFGLPVRYDWAADYRGAAMVVYGHTPVPTPEWFNGTINVDTGCVFGGGLTALRYPERDWTTVPARETYCEPTRPIAGRGDDGLSFQQAHDDVLDVADMLGKRIIATQLGRSVTIREENAVAAFEAMSRFAVDPKWLIYLPPTMSPCETSREPGMLEHPAEALAYFRDQGVAQAICQEKHMGSRAVVVVCRDERAARDRFGDASGRTGVIVTRTGRPFFSDGALETAMLGRIRDAATAAGLWDELATEWMCLDCELLPWSAKAQELLRSQYAAVGSAGRAATTRAVETIVSAAARLSGDEAARLTTLGRRFGRIRESVDQFVAAYRRYCWPVSSLDDLVLAPFHLLASERGVHADRDHVWHMETLARLAKHDPRLFRATPYRLVDLADPESEREAIAWWTELTARGGEGMVVKPLSFVVSNERGLVQPAVKCRGREYLRIIYSPDYTAAEHLERLRKRGLAGKRSLALREFALGIEGLERFVRREPLRRVHECVFGTLALESEPVDPRL